MIFFLQCLPQQVALFYPDLQICGQGRRHPVPFTETSSRFLEFWESINIWKWPSSVMCSTTTGSISWMMQWVMGRLGMIFSHRSVAASHHSPCTITCQTNKGRDALQGEAFQLQDVTGGSPPVHDWNLTSLNKKLQISPLFEILMCLRDWGYFHLFFPLS